jgi:hypothetical protein
VKESQIQKAIMDLLAAERIPAWRMNSGAMSGEHNGKRRFFRFGEKGMADILAAHTRKSGPAVFPGAQFLWIEVKAPKGLQTQEQIEFEKYVWLNGMNYIVARSVDDVIDWLRRNA